MELIAYMNNAIENIIQSVVKSSWKNPEELRFLTRTVSLQKKAARKRLSTLPSGFSVPPFLIASIATQCNLHCSGCYAREGHTCQDQPLKTELSASRWKEIFLEAEELGVSFVLLAGGEPLARPDVLEAAAVSEMIFPVFTNGTLFSDPMITFFHKHRNLIPIISIEGNQAQTDKRRGSGIYQIVMNTMSVMKEKSLLFGASITLSKENAKDALSDNYLDILSQSGCRLIFLVEYVPVDGNSEIAFDASDRIYLDQRLLELRTKFPNMLFLSFPGDEKALGGCLAAGRGFFHINAFGDAEPCPFSPFSDSSLKSGTLAHALESPLFRYLQSSGLESEEHSGGCALFEHQQEVARFLQ